MEAHHRTRTKNRSTITIMLVVAALLPLVPTGMFAGLVLGMMVLGWLVLAGKDDVRGRMALMIVAGLVILMNGAFSIGALT